MSALNDLTRELKRQRESAIDLSRRNRLININQKVGAKSLQIVDEVPDQIAQRLASSKEFTFLPIEDADGYHEPWIDGDGETDTFTIPLELPKSGAKNSAPRRHSDSKLQTNLLRDKLEPRLRNITSANRTELTERGISTLFLALGFLRYQGVDADHTENIAPLFLIPVGIEKKRMASGVVYALHGLGSEPRHNLSLGILLERDQDLVLPDLGDDGLSPEEYFQLIESQISKWKKPWSVIREARLDFFNYSGLAVNIDLDPESWPSDSSGVSTLVSNENVQQAIFGDIETDKPEIGNPDIYEIDEHPIGQKLVTPMPADSSQLSAIIDVLDGKSLIVEGPPGTGKSQTIANLIAMELARGRKVLFVAEKPAALEVVQNRLDRIGFEHYICYQHSATTSTAAIYEQLRARLALERPKPPNRRIEEIQKDLDRERLRIRNYLDCLHTESPPLDRSLHDLIWSLSLKIEQGGHIDSLNAAEKTQSRDEYVERTRLLEELASTLERSERDHFKAWINFPAPGYTNISKDSLISNATRFIELHQQWRAISNSVKNQAGSSINTKRNTAKQLQRGLSRAIADHVHPELDDIARAALPKWNDQKMSGAIESCHRASVPTSIKFEFSSKTSKLLVKTSDRFKSQRVWLTSDARSFASQITSINDSWKRVRVQASKLFPTERLDSINLEDLDRYKNGLNLAQGAIDAGLRNFQPRMLSRDFTRKLRDIYLAAKELVEYRDRLSTIYNLDNLPSAPHLRSMADRARMYHGKTLRFFLPGWHALRKQVRSTTHLHATSPAAFKPVTLGELAEFAESDNRFNEEAYPALQDVDVDFGGGQVLKRLNTAASFLNKLCNASLPADVYPSDLFEGAENNAFRDLFDTVQHEFNQFLDQIKGDTGRFIFGQDLKGPAKSLSFRQIDETLSHASHFASAIHSAMDEIDSNEQVTIQNMMQAASFSESLEAVQAHAEAWGIQWPESTREKRELATRIEQSLESIQSTLVIPHLPKLWIRDTAKASFTNACQKMIDLLTESDRLWEECEDLAKKIGDVLNCGFHHLDEDGEWQKAHALAELITDHADSLPSWSQISRLVERAKKLGIERWATTAIQGDVTPKAAILNFETSSIYDILLTNMSADPLLATITGDELSTARERFQRLESELRDLNLARLTRGAHTPNETLTLGNNAARVGEKSQYHLVSHEVSKQKRHLKLRPLFERAGDVLMELQPCWMMNPVTVAEVLPRIQGHFDLVVFDEASQIKTVHALGALARGKRFVVVGDPKQLPPTSFFDKTSGAEESDPDEHVSSTDSTSVLEALARTMPPRRYRRLLWHYRSEHESLIAFSNKKFYNGELIVFPAASRQEGNLGVSHSYVADASFDDGRNMVEATAVANAVIKHAKSLHKLDSPISLGVAAMNRRQAELITELIDKLSEGDQEATAALRDLESLGEPLFVKNLENVQGDERDLIFISFTYGPDPASGRVMQRFGPINQSGGWKRLNVLVTRARRAVTAFSSMHARDIVIGPKSSQGAVAMRDYLEYAETGAILDRGTDSAGGFENPFEESVARCLSDMDVEVVPQVGVAGFFIDLGVRLPGRSDYILGIECDGATYHSAKSARDRDAIRQAVIESKGWTIHRIWSTDWFNNREHAIDRLHRSLQRAASDQGLAKLI